MLKRRLLLLLCVLGLMFSMMSCSTSEATDENAGKSDSASDSDEQNPPDDTEEEKNDVPAKNDETSEGNEVEAESGSDENEAENVVPEPDEQEPVVDSDQNEMNQEPFEDPSTSNWSSADLTADEIEALLNDPYMILVNRQNKVTADFEPIDLINYAGEKLNKTCADALKRLINDGKSAGYDYVLYSGYRTYNTQYNKYYNKIASYKNQGYSEEKAIELTDQYYAQPGASEHHTGLAADVCIPRIVNKYACLHEAYADTPEFEWFSTHAHEYGFILRYGETQTSITGYSYEPWHYRYVGVDVATEIYRRGITYEEFIWELEERLEKLKK